MKKRPLTPKQKVFIAEYLRDLNATQAAIRCGYSKNGASVHGHRLLRNSRIAKELAARQLAQLERAELSAARVLEELRRVAFVDVRTFFDEFNNIKPMSELGEDQGSAMSAMEVVIKNVDAGDGHTDTVHKFKLWDKVRALESLAKHFGLLEDSLKISLDDDLIAILNDGRARTAAVKKERDAEKAAANR